MRKFIAIIAAILLAFLITGGIVAWQGTDLSRDGILGLFQQSEDTTPQLPQAEESEELNLSYEEHLEKGDYYFERGFLTFASNEYVLRSISFGAAKATGPFLEPAMLGLVTKLTWLLSLNCIRVPGAPCPNVGIFNSLENNRIYLSIVYKRETFGFFNPIF